MDDLGRLVDLLDAAVARAAGVVPEPEVRAAAEVARRARRRRGYLSGSLVVALAGGTGSGKSSLLNAIAGEEVAVVGELRPTTSRPLAWIPADPEPGLVRLLDDLGIEDRVGHHGLDWLTVVDLPDTDSVDVDHRHTVESLLPQVDAVIWVLDPEKYQDAVLHRDFIRPAAAHADRLWFVLNQIDRVDPDEVPALVEDLESSLREDGVDSPRVLVASAGPPSGPPEIQPVEAMLHAGMDVKRTVTAKLVTDVRMATRRLIGAGLTPGGTGFEARWSTARSEAASLVADGLGWESSSPESAAAAAAAPIRGLLLELAAGATEGTSGRLRELASTVDGEIREAGMAAAAEPVPPPPRPGLLGVGRLARMLLAAASGLGAIWFVAAVLRGGDLAPPAVLALVASGLWAVLHVVVSGARRRWEAVAEEERRQEHAARVERRLDRRIGAPARSILRERAEAAAALTDLGLELSGWEDA